MNTRYPTLSADGLRFEAEFARESNNDSERGTDVRASAQDGGESRVEAVEELMILGR